MVLAKGLKESEERTSLSTKDLTETTFALERGSKSVSLQLMTLIILVAWCLALLVETIALLFGLVMLCIKTLSYVR